MSTLKQNVASQPIPIVLRRPDLSVIGTTTGVTVTVGLDTTTLTSGAGSLSYVSGQLYYTPTQGETNGNVLIVKATHAEAAEDWFDSFALLPVPANFSSFAIDANGRIQIQSGTATGQLSQSSGTVAVGSVTSGAANSLGDAMIGRLDAVSVPGSPTAGTYAERFSKIQASDNVATTGELQAEVAAINQSASRRVVLVNIQQFERPESGSSAFTVEARTYDGDGAAVNADSTPTLTATGSTTGSLAANLGAASNPATGVYRWTYTVANDATLEQIRFDLAATIDSSTFTISSYAFVCDFVASTFTTADRALLTTIETATQEATLEAIIVDSTPGAQFFDMQPEVVASDPTEWPTYKGKIDAIDTAAAAAQTAAESTDGKLTSGRLSKIDRIQDTGTVAASSEVSGIALANLTAEKIAPGRTFRVAWEGNRSDNIVTLNTWSSGTITLAADFDGSNKSNGLNPGTTISTLDSVTVTNQADDTTVTTSELRVQQTLTAVNFDVAAIAAAGRFTVVIEVTTSDSQTLSMVGELVVEAP